jgi:hypothetical protein
LWHQYLLNQYVVIMFAVFLSLYQHFGICKYVK